jgi:ubiquinol-cytochrome c reductase cytochrome b subunit
VGTIVLPSLVGAYFFALPLFDRKPSTALRPRLLVLAPVLAVAAGIIVLTLVAKRDDAGDVGFQKERVKADERAEAANRIAMAGVPPEGPLAMMKSAPELRGPELFDKSCAGCHMLGDHGVDKDRTAPKLDGWGTEKWALAMLHDPDADDHFGRTTYKGEMPSVDIAPKDAPKTWKPMADDDKRAVAAFLASQGDDPKDPKRDAALLAKGKSIVTTRCTTCHLFGGEGDDGGEGLAPELSGWGSVAWVRAQIANPSSKATYREHALDADRKGHMPRFDQELQPQDLDLLAGWVRSAARK